MNDFWKGGRFMFVLVRFAGISDRAVGRIIVPRRGREMSLLQ